MKTLSQTDRPLNGLTILDFSQFLSGPVCTLKLADLGARVIKVERPNIGDLCRYIYLTDTELDGDNTLFHAINRNKESIEADLRDESDRQKLFKLLKKADVMIQNFRPGVIDRLGFGYEDVKKINSKIIYGSISGFGEDGPWKDLPGQDLLAQARSGLLWLTGSQNDPPMPMGLAVADMMAGNSLAQGVLAALVGRGINGCGALVETSLMEAMLDFQFEVLTTYFNDGNRIPKRSKCNGAHAYLGAPYGVYETADGYLALAMTPSLKKLAKLLEIKGLEQYYEKEGALLVKRDEIKNAIAKQIKTRGTNEWLSVLQPEDIWCSEVLDWPTLLQTAAYKMLDFEQTIRRDSNVEITTVRSPIRFNSGTLKSPVAAPTLGQNNNEIFGAESV